MNQEEINTHVEAVLYTTGKYMTLEDISEACGIEDVKIVSSSIENLKKKYATGDGALEIQEQNDRFKLNIKKRYGFIASKLSGEAEFDGPTIKTLAVVAYKSPVMQSEIIKIRGNKSYDHLSQLKSDGLITSEKCGRSRMLKLSNKFFEYFDVAEKEVKDKLENIDGDVRKNVAWKMGTTAEHLANLEKSIEEQTKEVLKEEEIKEDENNSSENKEDEPEDKNVYDDKGKIIGVLGD